MVKPGIFLNADDYCLSENVNRAIADLATKRLISATTVIVNNDQLDLGYELSRLHNITLGFHLNLTLGTPVSPVADVYSLVDKDGVFYAPDKLWMRFLLGRIRRDHIRREIRAQYERLNQYIRPEHVDSHKHIHCFPFLGEFILSCLHELKVEHVRNPRPLYARNRGYRLLRLFCARYLWKRKLALFDHTEGIISLDFLDSLEILAEYKDRNVEFVAHPAVEDEISYLSKKQMYELLLKEHHAIS